MVHIMILCTHMDVGVREFRDNVSKYLERVARGERLTVSRHGQPMAELLPPGGERSIDELIDAGIVEWNGKKADLPPCKEALSGEGPSISDYVLKGRD